MIHNEAPAETFTLTVDESELAVIAQALGVFAAVARADGQDAIAAELATFADSLGKRVKPDYATATFSSATFGFRSTTTQAGVTR